jgi:hypothetical protein
VRARKQVVPGAAGAVGHTGRIDKSSKDESELSQAEKFAQYARDLDGDEEAFTSVLRKLAKPKSV